ncbi:MULTISPECIES: M56 family metallopeptidase [Dyella]|uniref:Peptidase M56 n=2 Tax=Dyella TaxID=231454 RepID=A0A4R0YUV4_9GAMM|nr:MULTISPECIES: M56 family metallopeptidase [Dyella]TBR40166.1 peptidase M56 [Dyella terrae]TCI12251.1 peptidase M56 [Dyella soli]
MNSPEGFSLLLRLLLGFTLAAALVLGVRIPFRRRFGASAGFWLWGMVPVAMVIAAWPHAPLPSVWLARVGIAETAGHVQTTATAVSAGSVSRTVTWLWLLGNVLMLVVGALAQWRFLSALQRGKACGRTEAGVEIRRLETPRMGPALVGWLRPVIVLPADFESRFLAAEQRLILAHESMHARRNDGLWSLLAHVVLSICWMHPLAWMARRRFRLDLELACDAAVMRTHTAERGVYASALLKDSPMAGFLPAGSTWSPVHPLKERIAMLKQPRLHPARRAAGQLVLALGGVVLGGAVYAATGAATTKHEYQLDFSVTRAWDMPGKRHSERADLSLCMPAGEAGTIKVRDWTADATVTPQSDGRMAVKIAVNDVSGSASTESTGALGEKLHSVTKAGKVDYSFDMTPREGCPARDQAAKKA